jgi:hypothetical protein
MKIRATEQTNFIAFLKDVKVGVSFSVPNIKVSKNP